MQDGNFKLLAERMNIEPLLNELSNFRELWRQTTVRQDTPGSPHHDTEAIIIAGPRELTVEAAFNDLESVVYPAGNSLLDVWPLIDQIATLVNSSKLGRAMIVSLKAGGVIDRHFDDGAYAAHYSRFHLCLQSDEGNSFDCGDETVHMRPGELWQFDHHKYHSVTNASDRARIHLIVDAVTQ